MEAKAHKNNGYASLELKPVKMGRKVSFRDEKEHKPIADVNYVENYSKVTTSEESCLKCQLL